MAAFGATENTGPGAAATTFLQTRRNLSKQSVAKYRSVLGQLVRYAGKKTALNLLTAAKVQAFIDATDRRAITKRTYSTTLSPFFNWAVVEGLIEKNPVKGLRLPRVPEKTPKTLSQEQVDILLQTIEEAERHCNGRQKGSWNWLVPAIKLSLLLGLRVAELAQLRWEDIDEGRGLVTIGGRESFKTKNGKRRVLPLTDAARDVLLQASNPSPNVITSSSGDAVSPLYLSRRFKDACRLAGLSDHLSFHCLRHTACSRMANSGASLEAVRRIMGHSSVRVTERYLHVSQMDLKAALERL